MDENENFDVNIKTENENLSSYEDILSENTMLKKKLEILMKGVNVKYLDDAYKLSESSDLDELIKKYPEYTSSNININTGVYEKNNANDTDNSLRKAFGLCR